MKHTAPTYTVTKYDAAQSYGHQRSNPSHYLFDAVDQQGQNQIIVGIQHNTGSAVATIEDYDILSHPINNDTAQKIGVFTLRAASANLRRNGVASLSSEEPTSLEVHALIEAFGAENLAFQPPLESIPTPDESVFTKTTVTIDLASIDMSEWPEWPVAQPYPEHNIS